MAIDVKAGFGRTLRVECAFGGTGDPATWQWTPVELYDSTSIAITWGRQDETDAVTPSSVSLALDNRTGAYTPGHAMSPHYPGVVENVPIRIYLADPEGDLYRYSGFVIEWAVDWPYGDLADNDLTREQLDDLDAVGLSERDLGEALCLVKASGVLHRLAQADPLEDAPTLWARSVPVLAHWPMTDSAGSTEARLDAGYGASAKRTRGPLPDWGAGSVGAHLNPVIQVDGDNTGVGNRRTIMRGELGANRVQQWAADLLISAEEDVPDFFVDTIATIDTTAQRKNFRLLTDGTGNYVLSIATLGSEDVVVSTLATIDATSLMDGAPHHLRIRLYHQSQTRLQVMFDGAAVYDAVVNTHWPGLTYGQVLYAGAGAGLAGRQSFGYLMVWSDGTGAAPERFMPTTDYVGSVYAGFSGEQALDRIIRLGEGYEVPIAYDTVPVVVDTFDRVVADGLGTADTGQDWVPPDEVYDTAVSVDGSDAVLTPPVDEPVQVGRWTIGDPDYDGVVDMRASITAPFDPDDPEQNVSFALYPRIVPDTGTWVEVWNVVDGSSAVAIAFVFTDDGIFDALLYDVQGPFTGELSFRVQLDRGGVRAKMWRTGDPEPSFWMGSFAGAAGLIPAGATGFDLSSATDGTPAYIHSFEVGHPEATTVMGPQRPEKILDLFREAEEIDGGVLYEARESHGLQYRTRASIENQAPVVVLDAGTFPGEITVPFAPVLNDSYLVNDVTASRPEGGSVRVVDEAHIASRSRYPETVTFNAVSDLQLVPLAGWRLHFGTWPGMRYPTVSPHLNAAVPGLADRWVPATIGDRIDVTGLPVQHPESDVSLILQGYAETIAPKLWDVTANCTPEGVWRTGAVINEDGTSPYPSGRVDKIDTDMSSLRAAVDGADDELVVVTLAAPGSPELHWTTDPADWMVTEPDPDASLGPQDAAAQLSTSSSASFVCPSVTSPENGSLLIGCVNTWSEDLVTLTLPGGTAPLVPTGGGPAQVDGTWSASVAFTETVPAGPTGTRTVASDEPDAWSGVSIVVGGTVTPTIDWAAVNLAEESDVVLDAPAAVTEGQWILVVHGFDGEGSDVMGSLVPTASGSLDAVLTSWTLLADAGYSGGDASRQTVWLAEVTTDATLGPGQTVTLAIGASDAVDNHGRLLVLGQTQGQPFGPLDITIGGERMRVTSISAPDPVVWDGPDENDLGPAMEQVFTVERAVNGIRKPHPSGAVVHVADPYRVAL